MAKLNKRQIAARKGAKTRAINRESWKRWHEVELPSFERADRLFNEFVTAWKVDVRLSPLGDRTLRLKGGAEKGRIVKFLFGGRRIRVKVDGYKRPQDYSWEYWEPILDLERAEVR